ncbi:MAG: hypothetical protein IPM53_20820 [Anaerolineaceae bacterium]|nr:hypothetical protein [Anaerolineaceae bacterium]
MHDLDRTAREFEWENDGYGNHEYDEYEYDDEFEFDNEYEYDYESPLTDAEEMELAAELLEITSDEELDMFLGKMFKKIGRGFRNFARSSFGRTLGGILKGVAKKALPIAGGVLGSIVPGVGTALGSGLGAAASRMFELELEGMSPEDQEFEIARRYVRLAAEAAKQAAIAPSGMPPREVANKAMLIAAQKHAPGLLRGTNAASRRRRKNQGMWKRHGNKIVLYGM